MKRRSLLALMTGAITAGSLSVGSGAFGFTRAERELDVTVADDDEAYLYMDPLNTPDNEGNDMVRSIDYGSQISFHLPGYEESEELGLGSDSQYVFESLFEIRNQGTHDVEVYSSYEGEHLHDAAIHHDGEEYRDDNRSTVLEPGDKITDVGLFVDTTGVSPNQDFTTQITIKARNPSAE